MGNPMEVDVLGLAKAEAAIRGLPFFAQGKVRQEVAATAIEIQTDARKRVTKSKAVDQGDLRASIQFWYSSDFLTASIGSKMKHAPWVEFGTGPAAGQPAFMPPPGVLLDWMKRHGIPKEAEYVIRRAIGERGMKPRPFLFPAFEAAKPEYLRRLGHIFDTYKGG